MLSRPVLVFAGIAALLVGCGSDIDSDEPLGDQLGGDERDDFIDGFVEGAGGTVARSEAECVSNAMFDAGLTFEEIMAAQTNPIGPAATLLDEALPTCIDPTLDLDVPLEGTVREQIETGLTSSGLSAGQVECVIDAYIAAGFDARDLFLAGVEPNPDIDAVAIEAFGSCPE